MTRRAAWGLLLAACGGGSDRELYERSLHEDPDDAGLTCQGIGDPGLRGECQAQNAARDAAGGHPKRASEACEAIADPLWRDECWFLVSDSAELIGDDAIDTCRRAGRFRGNCLGHAIGREVRGTEIAHAKVGGEKALRAAIERVVRRYKPGAPDDQVAVTADTLTARILAARWKDGPFDAALCGNASEEACMQAYRISLNATPREVAVEELCAGPIDRAAVEAIRARSWTEPSEGLALRAWGIFCEDLHAGRISRDGRADMGATPLLPGSAFPGTP